MKKWSLEPRPHGSATVPNDNELFSDSARHAYLERLRNTPQACLWDFMDWRTTDATDEHR